MDQQETQNLIDLLDLALSFLQEMDESIADIKYGGTVEVSESCECGCSTIIESYDEALFKCLECGKIRG